MKQTKKWLVALCVFMVFMWICTIVSKSMYIKNLPTIQVEKPSKKYVEHVIEADGMVEAVDFVPVYTLAGVRVNDLYVHVGDYVNKGEVLYLLDMTEVNEKIQQNYQDIEKLRLQISDKLTNEQINLAVKNIETEWANEDYNQAVQEIENQIEQAQRNVAIAERKLKRHNEQKVDYDDENATIAWIMEKEALEDEVKTARQNVDNLMLTSLDTLRQKVRAIAKCETASQVDSSVRINEIEIERLTNDINKYSQVTCTGGKVIAPVSGYVSQINIQCGSRTSDMSDILLTDSDKQYYFTCNITKEQGRYIEISDEINLTIHDKRIKGQKKVNVDYMLVDNNGYKLRCCLSEKELSPGTSVTMNKTIKGKMHNLTIPVEALHKENGYYFVYVLQQREGILGMEFYIEKRNVYVTDQNDRYVAIESGISENDEVVLHSDKEIKDGTTVKKSGI